MAAAGKGADVWRMFWTSKTHRRQTAKKTKTAIPKCPFNGKAGLLFFTAGHRIFPQKTRFFNENPRNPRNVQGAPALLTACTFRGFWRFLAKNLGFGGQMRWPAVKKSRPKADT